MMDFFEEDFPILFNHNTSDLHNEIRERRSRIIRRYIRHQAISPFTRISLNHNPLNELEKKLFGNGRNNNEIKEKFLILLKKKRIKKKYGKFLIECIIKLMKNNFLTNIKMKTLYKTIFVSYMYFREKNNLIKKFIKCLPNLKIIKFLIGKYNNLKLRPKNNDNNINYNYLDKLFYNDILFIKMVLDIYDDFLNNNTYFEDIKFIKNYFLISINFYKEIDDELFENLKIDISIKYNIDFYKLKNKVNYNSMSKKDYINYLEEKQNNYVNLIGGMNDSNNLFIQ
jgi:hypothetical protein